MEKGQVATHQWRVGEILGFEGGIEIDGGD